MWRLKKDLFLFVVSCGFYLYFLVTYAQSDNDQDLPLWIQIVSPLVVLTLGLFYWKDRKEWKAWERMITEYGLQSKQHVSLLGKGQMSLSGYLSGHPLQIDLKEIDLEDGDNEICKIHVAMEMSRQGKDVAEKVKTLKDDVENIYPNRIKLEWNATGVVIILYVKSRLSTEMPEVSLVRSILECLDKICQE